MDIHDLEFMEGQAVLLGWHRLFGCCRAFGSLGFDAESSLNQRCFVSHHQRIDANLQSETSTLCLHGVGDDSSDFCRRSVSMSDEVLKRNH